MRATGIRHARGISVLVVWALLCNVLLPLIAPATAFAAPTLSLPSGTLSFPAGGAAVPIDGALTVGVGVGDAITSVTIKIDTNYQTGADVLAITNVSMLNGPPTPTFDAGTATLTIDVPAGDTAANWQAALRTATFVTSDQSVLTRTIFFTVTDDKSGFTTGTKSVNIVGANQPPVLSRNITQSIARLSTSAISGGAGGNLFTSDPDNTSAQLTYTVLTLPAAGTLSKLGTGLSVNDTFTQANVDSGGVTYLAPANTGNQTFTFTVSDGTTTIPSSPGSYTFTFTVTGAVAPVLAPGSASMSYPQNGAAATVDATITLTDADAPPAGDQISSARIQFTNGYVNGQDVLDADVTSTTIAKNFDASSGQLTLTGNATLAVYQTVLRSVTYRNTLAAPAGSRTLSWTATDINSNTSGAVTRTVNIVAHVAPVVAPSSGSMTYIKGEGATVIDASTLTVTDSDSTTLGSARVQITAGYISGQDLLEAPASLPGSITSSFDTSSGILTLSKSAPFASLSEYQDALRLVTYRNTSLSIAGSRTVTFTAIDETGLLSAAASRTVNIGTGSLPSIAPLTNTFSYGQGAAATVVDSTIVLTDTDAPAGASQITNARVQITSGYVSGQDVLAHGDLSGTSLTGIFTAGSGEIQFTGTGTLADYQQALRGMTYVNNAVAPTGSRTLTLTVTDTEGNVSAAATRTLTIVAHATPAIAPTSGNVAYIRGSSAIVVDGTGINVTDTDSPNLTSARVVVASGYANGQDVLGPTGSLAGGITSTFDSAGGALVLTGTSSVANYQAALRLVTYVNTNGALGVPTSRTLAFTVTDEVNLTSPVANRTVNIASGVAPVLSPTSGSLSYGQGNAATTIDTSFVLTDADAPASGGQISSVRIQVTSGFVLTQDVLGNGSLAGTSITAATDSASGALTLSGADTLANYQSVLHAVTYVNTLGTASGSRTVTFTVTDITGLTATATRTITIVAHAAPTITPTSGSVSYVRGSPAILIDSVLLTAGDTDSTVLTLVRAQITSGYINGQDVLGVSGSLPSGITAAPFDTATGTLTLNATTTSSLANFTTALRQITYVNTNPGASGGRTVSFTATDETNLTTVTAAQRSISVSAGASPTISPNSGSFSYSIGSPPVTMDATLTLTDADATGDHIASARIQFSANYVSGQDVLAVPDLSALGITSSFDTVAGALVLTGPATVAEFQTALQSVTYHNTNPVVATGFRNFNLTVTDVNGNAGTATRSVNITAHATPSITPASGTASYLQGRPPTVIDGTLFTIADGDSTILNSARAQVTGGYVNGQDVLGVSGALPGGITASPFDGPSGVLTLNGPALLTDFQAALRQITYVNNAAGATGSRTVSFNVVDDTNLTSGTATRAITISVGVPPVLTPANGTVSFPQAGSAAAIDVNFLLTDADAPGGTNQIAGAIITVTNNYVNGEDVLSVIGSLNGGITPSFDATSGALSLSGTTTIANYQDALRKVAYQNVLASATGSRTLSIVVTDVNANASSAATRTVNIVQKAAPSITPATGSMSYPRGAAATVIDGVAIQVTDTDSATLSSARIQVTSGYVNGQDFLAPTGALGGGINAAFDGPTGTLTLTGPATPAQFTSALRLVTYRNANGSATGTRTISYVALDELNLTSATATRTVTIVSQAVPIVAPSTGLLSYTAGSAAVALDGSFTITDIDSSSLANNDGIRITMSPFFTNQDRLSTAASLPAGFSQSFDVNTGVLTIDCTASCPQSLSAWQNALRSVTYNNLLSNPDKTDRLVSIIATDVDGNSSSPATRTITLIGAAGPPDFTGLLATDTINEDGSKTYDLVLSDPDTPLADLSIAVTSSNQTVLPNAGLLLAGTGSDRHLTVTPAPNRNTGGGSPVIVTVTVDDGSSTVSHTLTLTVAPVNDAPTISTLSDRSTTASSPISFGITVGDVDTGDQLTVTGNSSNTAVVPNAGIVITPAGPATTTNRTVTITPTAAIGQTTITLTVADNGSPALSTSATFTLTVSGSAAPTISAIGPQTTSVNTATPPISFTINDPDTAFTSLALSATSSNAAIVEDGVGGSTITFAGTGPNRTVAVKPKTGAVGSTTISINVTDQTNTATASFVLTVTPGGPAVTVNQPLSVPRGGFATIGTSVLTAADPDTAAIGLAFNVVAAPGAGTLRRNGSPTTSFTQDDIVNGRISYLHNGGVQTSDSFNFTVTDGTSTTGPAVFSIQVTSDSISPTTIRNTGLTVGKGASAGITRAQLEIGDANTPVEAITFNVLPGPANGVLKRNGSPTATFSQADINNGLVSYQHDGSATSTDSFTFTATDGTNTTGAIVFSITIVGGNTPPSLTVASSVSVAQGKSVKLDGSVLKATDPDNNPSQLTYTVTTAPSHGALRRNNQSMGSTFTQAEVDAGSISYLHDGTRTASDSLSVRVSDGTNQTGIATLPIQISVGNSVPRLVTNTGMTVNAGLSTTIVNTMLLATDDDNDIAQLVYTIVAAPGSGEIRRYSTPVTSFSQEDIDGGRISYAQNKQPNPGSDAFTFTLSDGTNTLGRTSFSITIVGTPPVTCPLSSNVPDSVLDLAQVSTVSNGVRMATVCTDLKIDVQTSIGKVTLEIPDDTRLSAPSLYWDGKVNLPLLITNLTLTTPGANGRPTTPTAIVQVGSENVPISSDKTIKLTIPNRAGQMAGLKQGNQYIGAGSDCSSLCAANAGPNLTLSGKTLGGLYFTYTDGCTPRPDVKITSVMQGTGADRHLVATVAVTSVGGTSVNGLTAVKISKKATNAVIEVNGRSVSMNDGTANEYVTLSPQAGATSFSFVVRRADPTQGVTVPVIAVDTCGGDWRTFVGAGMDAFR